MTRIASFVYLINTFLPLLLVAALVVGGWHVWTVWVQAIAPQVAAAKAAGEEVLGELDATRTRLEAVGARIVRKGAEIEIALDAAGKPVKDVVATVTTIANMSLSVRTPRLTFNDIRYRDPITRRMRDLKVGPVQLKTPALDMRGPPLAIRLPQPVKVAFNDLGATLSNMAKVFEPFGAIVTEIRSVGPELELLRARMADLEAELARSQAAATRAAEAMRPVVVGVQWAAILLGPWLVLSYLCWVWLRLRRWRQLLAGGVV